MTEPFNISEEDEVLMPSVVAKRLGVSRQTFAKHCENGEGPAHIFVFGKKRYLASVVNQWMKEHNQAESEKDLAQAATNAIPK